MSYVKKTQWSIEPDDSFKVIRNCSKCGCKTNYVNTNNFRVNANGNNIDVWLIYQCEKCKNTWNLEIYKRIKPSKLSQREYRKFLDNDEALAFKYGTEKEFFKGNKAIINEESIKFQAINIDGHTVVEEGQILVIRNPYGLKFRLDKVLSEIMGKSRSDIKDLIERKKIYNPNMVKLAKIYTEQSIELVIG